MELSADGVSGSLRCRRQEFVAVDPGGNAAAAVARLDAHNFRKTSDVHISGKGDFAGQGEDEFNRGSRSEVLFNQEIKAPKTDVACLSAFFASARFSGTNR